MDIIQTAIPGVLIIEPRVFRDARGYFFESFSQREFDEKVVPLLGHKVNFVQDNESMSSYGVMRGLHYQRMPYTQSKLVRCVRGAVLDVAVEAAVVDAVEVSAGFLVSSTGFVCVAGAVVCGAGVVVTATSVFSAG